MSETRYEQIKARMKQLSEEMTSIRQELKIKEREFTALAKEKWDLEKKMIPIKRIPIGCTKKSHNPSFATVMSKFERGLISKEAMLNQLVEALK